MKNELSCQDNIRIGLKHQIQKQLALQKIFFCFNLSKFFRSNTPLEKSVQNGELHNEYIWIILYNISNVACYL